MKNVIVKTIGSLVVAASFGLFSTVTLADDPSVGVRTLGVDGTSQAYCNNPCWAWVYEEPNFKGENDILCGPFKRGDLKELPGAHRKNWSDDIGSIRVGPRATLRVWEDDGFQGESFFLDAGMAVANLEDSHQEEIESMELFCWKVDLVRNQ